MSKPFKYYYRSKNEVEKTNAISAERNELYDAFYNALEMPNGYGFFVIMDQKGSEVILIYAWIKSESEEEPPNDPPFDLEVPYFYEGRENNVTFIETNRAWGPKPIRAFTRVALLSELKQIIEELPEIFYQDCVPGCQLGRGYFYRD